MLKQTNNKNMTCHKDYKICKIGKGLLWAGTFQRRKCASQKKGCPYNRRRKVVMKCTKHDLKDFMEKVEPRFFYARIGLSWIQNNARADKDKQF